MTAARAPGKLILSGEHAVAYGAPALVAALARYTTVRFRPIHRSRSLRTTLKGIASGRSLPVAALDSLRALLDRRFERFRNGTLPIRNILQRPDDLLLYTLAQFARQLPVPGRTPYGLPMPGHLHSESDLPLGAGMGSSAAVIAATLVLYEHLLDKPQTLNARFERIRFCERLQHGSGSSVDAAAVTYGGIHRLDRSIPQAFDIRLDNWYWILSGIPESSTGECVSSVRTRLAGDEALWAAFRACTESLGEALQKRRSPVDALRENHTLLKRIGVVPEATTCLIESIERAGGGAKISGAGSIRGDKGGIVIAWHPDAERLRDLIDRRFPGLAWGAVTIAAQGAALLDEDG